jgi:hypothetical protein
MRARSLALGLSTLGLWLCVAIPSAVAADADPTKEQCTCSLSKTSKVGSWTVNAAACIRHDFPSWCDVYVRALESTPQHQQLLTALLDAEKNADVDPSKLIAAIDGWFDRYVKAVSEKPRDIKFPFEDDRKAIDVALRENSKTVAECIRMFRDRKPVQFNEKTLSCSVGEISKWLSITIERDGRRYTFLLAPLA